MVFSPFLSVEIFWFALRQQKAEIPMGGFSKTVEKTIGQILFLAIALLQVCVYWRFSVTAIANIALLKSKETNLWILHAFITYRLFQCSMGIVRDIVPLVLRILTPNHQELSTGWTY